MKVWRGPEWAAAFPHTLIRMTCDKYDVPAAMLYAIIKVESGGDPYATRFEPNYTAFVSPREYAEENLITVKTEEIHQATSWGLCQVMGATARRLGLEAPIPTLIEKDINIEYACKAIQDIRTRYIRLYEQAAAYNAGRVRRKADGTLVNQRYVTKFDKYYQDIVRFV